MGSRPHPQGCDLLRSHLEPCWHLPGLGLGGWGRPVQKSQGKEICNFYLFTYFELLQMNYCDNFSPSLTFVTNDPKNRVIPSGKSHHTRCQAAQFCSGLRPAVRAFPALPADGCFQGMYPGQLLAPCLFPLFHFQKQAYLWPETVERVGRRMPTLLDAMCNLVKHSVVFFL